MRVAKFWAARGTPLVVSTQLVSYADVLHFLAFTWNCAPLSLSAFPESPRI